MRPLARLTLAVGAGLAGGPVAAHGVWQGGVEHAPAWLLQALYVLAWVGHALGAARVPARPARGLAFHAALLLAGVALFGPLDDWAAHSTAMHMVQHMVLIVGVAPLLVVAQPLAQWRACFGRLPVALARGPLRLAAAPMAAATVHALAIWAWHAPGPYTVALLHEGWHVLEHASFLLTAWIFWWSVWRAPAARGFAALAALLFTSMHTGLLGALLTFAPQPLYLRESRDLWDQQLAGLVMWVPGGIAYLAAAAWSAARLLDRANHRAPG
ncbi:cytochrome c oxidase assembly protein [Schlegelella aquatica]|uniref:cytochrome c oxidase assembly protein n=1 Tax=Caldimonas aquatica TaxID=376175 RepID=UPI003750C866